MPSGIEIAPLTQRLYKPYTTSRSALICPYRDLSLQAPPTTALSSLHSWAAAVRWRSRRPRST